MKTAMFAFVAFLPALTLGQENPYKVANGRHGSTSAAPKSQNKGAISAPSAVPQGLGTSIQATSVRSGFSRTLKPHAFSRTGGGITPSGTMIRARTIHTNSYSTHTTSVKAADAGVPSGSASGQGAATPPSNKQNDPGTGTSGQGAATSPSNKPNDPGTGAFGQQGAPTPPSNKPNDPGTGAFGQQGAPTPPSNKPNDPGTGAFGQQGAATPPPNKQGGSSTSAPDTQNGATAPPTDKQGGSGTPSSGPQNGATAPPSDKQGSSGTPSFGPQNAAAPPSRKQ